MASIWKRRRSRMGGGRLVKVQNANTAAPAGQPQFTGWCLDKEDLSCQALCVQEKDRNFVAALLEARLVNAGVIHERLPSVEEDAGPMPTVL